MTRADGSIGRGLMAGHRSRYEDREPQAIVNLDPTHGKLLPSHARTCGGRAMSQAPCGIAGIVTISDAIDTGRRGRIRGRPVPGSSRAGSRASLAVYWAYGHVAPSSSTQRSRRR